MIEIVNNGYNNFNVKVAVSLSTKTQVGTDKTLKQLLNILKNGGNAKIVGTFDSDTVEIPNALGKNGDALVLAGISDASGTAVTYTGEFEMGTGANKEKLYLTVHSS